MAIGDLLRNIVGINPANPQEAIMTPPPAAATDGAQPGAATPIAPQPTAPAGGAPAAQDGAAPQVIPAPAAAAAPPDLSTLYQKLMDKERSQRAMDSGLTLMAAGLASPENRAALIGMASNQQTAGMGQAASTLKTIMGLQNNQTELIRREALRKQLPQISKQLGIPIEQVQQMFENNKLEDLLKQNNAPHYVENTNGATGDKTVQNVVAPNATPTVVPGGLAPNMHVTKDDSSGASTARDLNHPDKAPVPLGGGLAPNIQVTKDDGTGQSTARDLNHPDKAPVPLGGSLAPHYESNTDGSTGGKIVQDVNRPGRAPVEISGGLKPDFRTIPNGNGQTMVLDGNTGTVDPAKTIDTEKASNYQQVTDPSTGKITLVDLAHPLAPHIPLNTAKNMDTNDTKNYTTYLNDPLRKGDPKDFDTWLQEQNKQKATQTQVEKGSQAVVQAFAPEWQKMHQEGNASYETNGIIRGARGILEDPNSPIVAGSKMSPYTLEGRKLLKDVFSPFGLDDKATTNTETLMSAMKEIVLPKVKALGTGNSISDADRKFIESAVGGNIELNPDSMRRILRIMDVHSRVEAIDRAAKLSGLKQGMDPDSAKFIPVNNVPEFDRSAIPHVPDAAIKHLQEHPEDRKQFDAKYTTGGHMQLSKFVLGN